MLLLSAHFFLNDSMSKPEAYLQFRYQSALRILGYDVEMCHNFMNSSML